MNLRKVMYGRKCPGDANWTITQPITNDGLNETYITQLLEVGRPHMDLDNTNHVVHIALAEADSYGNNSLSNVWWVHQQWEACE